jgi:hypothetical protein
MTWYKDVGGDLTVIQTMDDIVDGATWVKTANNFSDVDKSKLDALSLTGETADETITRINSGALALSLDRIDDSSSTKKLVTAGELLGAQRASAMLNATGLEDSVLIGGKTASLIKSQTDDAFMKTSDTLDNISEGATKKSVSSDYVDATGRPTALYDEATEIKRGLGTGANSIPVLDADSRIAGNQMPKKALMQNVAGKIETSEAVPVKIDDLAMDGKFKPVSVESGNEDLRTNTLFSDPLLSLTGGATQRIYNTQSTDWTMFCAIPVVFDNLDLNLKMKILARMVAGSGTPKGTIRIICRDDNGGKPDDSVFVNNYTEIETTDAVFNRGDITKLDFFNSWSLTEGAMYWLTIEGKVSDVLDKLEMAGPLIYTESKILS